MYNYIKGQNSLQNLKQKTRTGTMNRKLASVSTRDLEMELISRKRRAAIRRANRNHQSATRRQASTLSLEPFEDDFGSQTVREWAQAAADETGAELVFCKEPTPNSDIIDVKFMGTRQQLWEVYNLYEEGNASLYDFESIVED